ncbi:MAG: hypothetical protein OXQ89_16605 [Rhodospirillaceae bacterium]|nr:hypothetical protein [Rhodospirillaceae bacterium]MDE0362405.1 hypothetical protein [Rhodospirillaceae bacterium]
MKAPQKKRPLARFRLRSSDNGGRGVTRPGEGYLFAAAPMPFFVTGGVRETPRS